MIDFEGLKALAGKSNEAGLTLQEEVAAAGIDPDAVGQLADELSQHALAGLMTGKFDLPGAMAGLVISGFALGLAAAQKVEA